MATETPTKVLKCTKCPRTFKTQGALNGHQRSHSFFTFLGKEMPKEYSEEAQDERRTRIMLAAIKHYTENGSEAHCDICAVVYETIDQPLMRDLAAYFEKESHEQHQA